MHIQGGRLYGNKIIGQTLYLIFIYPNGLNSSVVSPSLTLWGSIVNDSWIWSNFFLVSQSAGCHNTPPLTCFSWCHFISVVVFVDINNCCSLDLSGKYRKTFHGTFLFFLIPPLFGYHLESLQTVH